MGYERFFLKSVTKRYEHFSFHKSKNLFLTAKIFYGESFKNKSVCKWFFYIWHQLISSSKKNL